MIKDLLVHIGLQCDAQTPPQAYLALIPPTIASRNNDMKLVAATTVIKVQTLAVVLLSDCGGGIIEENPK